MLPGSHPSTVRWLPSSGFLSEPPSKPKRRRRRANQGSRQAGPRCPPAAPTSAQSTRASLSPSSLPPPPPPQKRPAAREAVAGETGRVSSPLRTGTDQKHCGSRCEDREAAEWDLAKSRLWSPPPFPEPSSTQDRGASAGGGTAPSRREVWGRAAGGVGVRPSRLEGGAEVSGRREAARRCPRPRPTRGFSRGGGRMPTVWQLIAAAAGGSRRSRHGNAAAEHCCQSPGAAGAS